MFDRISEGRWWDRAWSLVEGCTPCSPGCEKCWLRAMDRRFRGADMPVRFRGDRIFLPRNRGEKTAWAVWSDLYHEKISDLDIRSALLMAGDARRHVFLVLTKRPERMAELGDMSLLGGWPDNVWAGVTVCNQEEADAKIPLLLQTPAEVRFISYEPALGPVDLTLIQVSAPVGWSDGGKTIINALSGVRKNIYAENRFALDRVPRINWVIAGGESGPGARPAQADWFRGVRDQCQANGVPFFFKQWGEWAPGLGDGMMRVGKKVAGRKLDGRTWDGVPK